MIRILKETHFNFINARKKAFIISAVLIVAGFISLIVRGGMNYGIDFSGGTLIQLHFDNPITTAEIRNALNDIGLSEAQIQRFGTANDFLIKAPALESFVSDTVGPEVTLTAEAEKETKNIILKAAVSDRARGNGVIRTVELFIDSLGAPGQGIEMSGVDVFDTPEEQAVSSIPTSRWVANTTHLLFVRGMDTNGNWGKAKKLRVALDKDGMLIPPEEPSSEPEEVVPKKQSTETFGIIIKSKLEELFPDNSVRIDREEMVGPAVSKNLQWKALWVVLLGMLAILIYISFRFTFRFGVGAVIALFHDVIITIGALSIFGKEFTIPIVAAILTIVGYSINDTIVISDRIRENLKMMRKDNYGDVINRSINQTLSRTIITSLTTFIALFVLFVFGGRVINDFSFALLIGVVIGTYSSIFVVAPIVYEWERKSPTRKRK
jgi:preprotein translocase subunit SecF